MPLAAEVGAVDDALAVGGPVGTGSPRGLFVADLARHRARPRRHAPESARPVDVAPVRHEEELAAVRRPRRREIVVPPAVVVAGEPAVLVLGQAGDRAALRVDRKSTRLNSSHITISYAVFCLKKKKNTTTT